MHNVALLFVIYILGLLNFISDVFSKRKFKFNFKNICRLIKEYIFGIERVLGFGNVLPAKLVLNETLTNSTSIIF
tara:strand:- start:266 stop:490 length:225 start_codon:yes stop_codon:yes gene_type:complete